MMAGRNRQASKVKFLDLGPAPPIRLAHVNKIDPIK